MIWSFRGDRVSRIETYLQRNAAFDALAEPEREQLASRATHLPGERDVRQRSPSQLQSRAFAHCAKLCQPNSG